MSVTVQDVLNVKNPFLAKLSVELHKLIDTDKVWVHDDNTDYPLQLSLHHGNRVVIVIPLTFGHLKLVFNPLTAWGYHLPRLDLNGVLQSPIRDLRVEWHTGYVNGRSPITTGKVRRLLNFDKATLATLPRLLDKHIPIFMKSLVKPYQEASAKNMVYKIYHLSDQYHGLRALLHTVKTSGTIDTSYKFDAIEHTMNDLRLQLLELKKAEVIPYNPQDFDHYYNSLRCI